MSQATNWSHNIILSWEKQKRHTCRTVKTATKKNKLVYFASSKLVFICHCQDKFTQGQCSLKCLLKCLLARNMSKNTEINYKKITCQLTHFN